jgi:hypothetical protein
VDLVGHGGDPVAQERRHPCLAGLWRPFA